MKFGKIVLLFLSFFVLCLLVPSGFCGEYYTGWVMADNQPTGNWENWDGYQFSSGGSASGTWGALGGSPDYTGISSFSAFTVAFVIRDFKATEQDFPWWSAWWDRLWVDSYKTFDVKLTVTDYWGNWVDPHQFWCNFSISARTGVYGTKNSVNLQYGLLSPKLPLPSEWQNEYPDFIDQVVTVTFLKNGTKDMTIALSYLDPTVRYASGVHEGEMCPIILTRNIACNTTDLFSAQVIAGMLLEHSGTGDMVVFMESRVYNGTSVPDVSGWDIVGTVKQTSDWVSDFLGMFAVFGSLATMLIGVAGVLIQNAPIVLFGFILSAGLACMYSMSFEPIRKIVDMVYNFAVGAWSVLTGIIGAIKDFIQWW